MSVLDRYIVRTILGTVALVMAVLLLLGALFVFIDQQDDVGVGHYTALGALWYSLPGPRKTRASYSTRRPTGIRKGWPIRTGSSANT